MKSTAERDIVELRPPLTIPMSSSSQVTLEQSTATKTNFVAIRSFTPGKAGQAIGDDGWE